MIKPKNYQPHERKLVQQLSNVDTLSPEDASMIIGINRRKGRTPFQVIERAHWDGRGPRPIFVQNGRYHHNFEEIDQTKTFWTILCIGETEIGAPRYAVSNCFSWFTPGTLIPKQKLATKSIRQSVFVFILQSFLQLFLYLYCLISSFLNEYFVV